MNPSDLRYAKSHEWVKLTDGIATVGITQFAVDQLTDVTYLELPKVGQSIGAGDEIGVIESVKSTSPIYTPVGGTVTEVNEAAVNDTSMINADPFGTGWLMKLQVDDGTTLDHLLTSEAYDAQIAAEG